MSNKKRQWIFIGILGVIVFYRGGTWLLENVIEGPMKKRNIQSVKLKRDLKKIRSNLRKVRNSAKEIVKWEKRSLPADSERARSAYRSWLTGIVSRVGIDKPNITAGSSLSRRNLYRSMVFTVSGKGTLEQVTRILYDFYKAPYLHRIQSIGLNPQRRSGTVDFSISIQALILPGANRSDELPTGTSDILARTDFEDYRIIAQRDFFSVGPAYDDSDHAYLTGMPSVNGQREIWFTIRTTDQLIKLQKGDLFSIGQFSGKIAEIHAPDVIIESDGERWLLSKGEKLSDAFVLPPEY